LRMAHGAFPRHLWLVAGMGDRAPEGESVEL
jgi:hypothetical protein